MTGPVTGGRSTILLNFPFFLIMCSDFLLKTYEVELCKISIQTSILGQNFGHNLERTYKISIVY